MPTVAAVGGFPEIVGAVADGLTVMLKGPTDAVLMPSCTVMTIFENVPAFADVGVPMSLPLAQKDAHDGLCDIVNHRVRPAGPLAVGRKL